jgi:hypothetical protein
VGEVTKHGFGGAFHPKCGSMRIFVLPVLPTARVDAFDSGPALSPSRPARVFSRFLIYARGMNAPRGAWWMSSLKGNGGRNRRSAGSDIVVEQKLCRPREIRRAERLA